MTAGIQQGVSGSGTEAHYDAFICYRRSDGSAVANWLFAKLRTFRLAPDFAPGLADVIRPTREHPLKVYIDRIYEGATVDYWKKAIRPALDRSRVLLVLWTPDAALEKPGEWDPMWAEIEHFLDHGREEDIVLIQVGVDREKVAPADLTARFPRMERRRLLGGDSAKLGLRRRLFPERDELVRIQARVCNVPADWTPELLQIDRRRETKRLRLLASAGGAISTVLAGLLVIASYFYSRSERSRAETAEALASALATRAVTEAKEAQRRKALIDLIEARRTSQRSYFDALSLLVGEPLVTRVAQTRVEGQISTLRFSSGGGELAVATPAGIVVLDLISGGRKTLPGSKGFGDLAFANDGEVIVGRNGNRLAWWETGRSTGPREVEVGDLIENAPLVAVAFGLAVHPRSGDVLFGLPDGRIGRARLDAAVEPRTYGSGGDWSDELAVSPDGRYLAWSTGNSSVVRLVDFEDGSELVLGPPGEPQFLNALEFSPDAALLAATGPSGELWVWSVESRALRFADTEHSGFVNAAAFSADGALLATGGADRSVVIRYADTGTVVSRIEEHQGGVTALSFTPDGKYLAVGTEGGRLRIWGLDPERGRPVRVPHCQGPAKVSLSSAGEWLALASCPGDLWLHADLPVAPAAARRLGAFDLLDIEVPPGVTYLSGSQPPRLLAVETGEVRPLPFPGSELIEVNGVVFAPSGDLIGTTDDGRLVLWPTPRFDSVASLELGRTRVDLPTVSSTGDLLAVAGPGFAVTVLRREAATSDVSWSVYGKLPTDGDDSGDAIERLLLDGGELLAAQTAAGALHLWQVIEGKRLEIGHLGPGVQPITLQDRYGLVVYDPDTQQLCTIHPERSRCEAVRFAAGLDAETPVLASTDGTRLAFTLEDGRIEIQPGPFGGAPTRLRSRRGRLSPLTFDPSGEVLVVAEWQKKVDQFGESRTPLQTILFDAATGRELGVLHERDPASHMVLSSNGSVAVVRRTGTYRSEWVELVKGITDWDVDRAERRTGMTFDRTAVIRRFSAVEEEGFDADWKGLDLDPELSTFWSAFWQTHFNLRMDGRNDLEAATSPLRTWVTRHPGHRKIWGLPERVVDLIYQGHEDDWLPPGVV